ncbi:hypothetical protein MMC19_005517 [Ptychographa xylographoides]|nr:hypothetical protein [Ptychographa xylographoides]
MDLFLGKVTQQAMNYAIRSGITITASYAIRQSSRFLKNVQESHDREELQALQERLQSKISIISPAIDMIELISARGNTSLESAVSITQSLRWEIQALGQRLATAANHEDLIRRQSSKARSNDENDLELKIIILQIKKLLTQIEDAVPLINLAITTSGARLSTTLPTTISPSRLLQASTFLTAGDTQYSVSPTKCVQIGPTFVLSMYMLFSGHLRPQNEEDIRQSTWKEVIHKARLKLIRVPLELIDALPDEAPQPSFGNSTNGNGISRSDGTSYSQSQLEAEGRADEFAYQILIVEDLDDDRVHTFEDGDGKPTAYDDVGLAGIREAIPIHEISKIFYADTGKILNIGSDGETNTPVLLLKRDVNAIPPRRMMARLNEDEKEDVEDDRNKYQTPRMDLEDENQSLIDAQFEREHRVSSFVSSKPQNSPKLSATLRLPTNLDPEWMAFEVYTESPDSDTESEVDTLTTESQKLPRTSSLDLDRDLAKLRLSGTSTPTSDPSKQLAGSTTFHHVDSRHTSAVPVIRTSLSLLETILRLLSLQQFQQTSHLSIPDELLNFFLSESATTGAANGDEQERRRFRNDARRRVGFDPYDESPIKRRGEEYQYRGGESQAGWQEHWDGRDERVENSSREQSFDDYRSQRSDEGYGTHRVYSPSYPGANGGKESHPNTPPLLLGENSYSSRSKTPDRPLRSSSNTSDNPRSSTPASFFPGTPPNRPVATGRPGRMRFDEHAKAVVRKGSPLARPSTGLTDKGLGTSPALMMESVEKNE